MEQTGERDRQGRAEHQRSRGYCLNNLEQPLRPDLGEFLDGAARGVLCDVRFVASSFRLFCLDKRPQCVRVPSRKIYSWVCVYWSSSFLFLYFFISFYLLKLGIPSGVRGSSRIFFFNWETLSGWIAIFQNNLCCAEDIENSYDIGKVMKRFLVEISEI